MHLLKRYGGELGILVDPDDVEELADVLIKVLKKKVPDELLDSNYIKKRTLENFGFTTFKNNLENIIKELT